jgi:heme A synthase
MVNRRFARYAWATLAWNVLVILWGAFVRATGSGAGCGSHWPLCGGVVIPRAPQVETLIEFSHRISSGIALVLVIGLVVWAFRAYPRGHVVRWGAGIALLLMITEALIGAGLVLFEYVAANLSVARAYWSAGHLINTFLLLAALALTAAWATGVPRPRLRGQGAVGWSFWIAAVAMLVLGASGGVTALGDTLVFTAGITPEESAWVAQLVSVRIYHPLLALVVGACVLLFAWLAYRRRPGTTTTRLTWMLVGLYGLQLLLGSLNVALQAPVWMQLVHLLVTDLLWIVLVLLGATALAAPEASVNSAEQPDLIAPSLPKHGAAY